ncbi:MAG TPA: GNAT family N-acetyltransferase, partial [Gaiellales bacterium]|nr:GNAT family N-acetyltransferase [Gaiellales bacterium]
MIALRPVEAADAPFLLRVFASSRPDLALLPEPLVRLQFAAQDAAYARARRSVVVVDGVDAGRLYVEVDRVVDITLLPEFRGRGIGTSLLEGLMDERVSLSVSVMNPARALYERLGFRVVSDDGAYLSMLWTPGTVSCSTAV